MTGSTSLCTRSLQEVTQTLRILFFKPINPACQRAPAAVAQQQNVEGEERVTCVGLNLLLALFSLCSDPPPPKPASLCKER